MDVNIGRLMQEPMLASSPWTPRAALGASPEPWASHSGRGGGEQGGEWECDVPPGRKRRAPATSPEHMGSALKRAALPTPFRASPPPSVIGRSRGSGSLVLGTPHQQTALLASPSPLPGCVGPALRNTPSPLPGFRGGSGLTVSKQGAFMEVTFQDGTFPDQDDCDGHSGGGNHSGSEDNSSPRDASSGSSDKGAAAAAIPTEGTEPVRDLSPALAAAPEGRVSPSPPTAGPAEAAAWTAARGGGAPPSMSFLRPKSEIGSSHHHHHHHGRLFGRAGGPNLRQSPGSIFRSVSAKSQVATAAMAATAAAHENRPLASRRGDPAPDNLASLAEAAAAAAAAATPGPNDRGCRPQGGLRHAGIPMGGPLIDAGAAGLGKGVHNNVHPGRHGYSGKDQSAYGEDSENNWRVGVAVARASVGNLVADGGGDDMFVMDTDLWIVVERGTVCEAAQCIYKSKTNGYSSRRHYHATCEHTHVEGPKLGMPFHHHQLEKVQKHQRAHAREAQKALPKEMSSKVRSAMAQANVEQYRPEDWNPKPLYPSQSTGEPFDGGETAVLAELVECLGAKNWPTIASNFRCKSAMQCMLHWRHALNGNAIVKGTGTWAADEDARLLSLVDLFGLRWAQVAGHMPGRMAKQCRERYLNHLDPTLRREPWTREEDEMLMYWHAKLENKFAKIADKIVGRSYNDVKNRWAQINRQICTIQTNQSVSRLPADQSGTGMPITEAKPGRLPHHRQQPGTSGGSPSSTTGSVHRSRQAVPRQYDLGWEDGVPALFLKDSSLSNETKLDSLCTTAVGVDDHPTSGAAGGRGARGHSAAPPCESKSERV